MAIQKPEFDFSAPDYSSCFTDSNLPYFLSERWPAASKICREKAYQGESFREKKTLQDQLDSVFYLSLFPLYKSDLNTALPKSTDRMIRLLSSYVTATNHSKRMSD